ncbi:MAG: coniferyl aldehyde dehydrogenase, partial [Comamonadaceae bacterium]|nr:coniferyl aldehyde dehydrogenase [Comamonadaceae bacterium]
MNASTHDTLGPLFETLRAASRTQPAWDWPARARRLRALRALLLRERAAICAAIAADFGQRPRQETELAELFPILSGIDHALAHGPRWMRPRRRATG